MASSLKLVRQEFGGQVSAHVRCDISSGAVINMRPGAFKPQRRRRVTAGTVVDKSAEVGALTARTPLSGDQSSPKPAMSISPSTSLLVSIGRGIQEKDNVAIAEELAEALGAAVSCSRPVVDAKWMEKSRQVGSSGKTVKPKVYLACGISGVVPASGRHQGQSVHRRHQQESRRPRSSRWPMSESSTTSWSSCPN